MFALHNTAVISEIVAITGSKSALPSYQTINYILIRASAALKAIHAQGVGRRRFGSRDGQHIAAVGADWNSMMSVKSAFSILSSTFLRWSGYSHVKGMLDWIKRLYGLYKASGAKKKKKETAKYASP